MDSVLPEVSKDRDGVSSHRKPEGVEEKEGQLRRSRFDATSRSNLLVVELLVTSSSLHVYEKEGIKFSEAFIREEMG